MITQALKVFPLLMGTQGGTGGGTGGGPGQLITMLVTFGLIIVIFYFLVIRPQNRKQKEAQRMLQNLHKGDRVVTAGGLRGSVVAVKEDSIVLKVDENVKIEFNKGAVTQVLERKEEPAEEPKA